MSPAKTAPWLTPIRSGSRALCRRSGGASRSIRSSSSPIARGAPATRMILPPSWSTSVPRNVTSCSSAAACTSRTSSSSAAASARRTLSLDDLVGAVEMDERDVACRCSGPRRPTRRCSRIASGTQPARSTPRVDAPGRPARRAPRAAARCSRNPAPLRLADHVARHAARRSRADRISPASAVPSISRPSAGRRTRDHELAMRAAHQEEVELAACGRPTDMRSRTMPAVVLSRPICRSSPAACRPRPGAARAAWPRP